MTIHFEHGIDVACPPQQVFAVLDDFSQTPRWLARCTGIERLSSGTNAVGTKVRYAYKEGGRSGTMDGEITARTPNERLTVRYSDAMMEVVVDFRMAATAAGAHLVHTIDLTPKTFFAKLLSPMIRRQMPKQTVTAMETLRALLASGA